GHFIDRPGHVRVRVDGDAVRGGGRAVVPMDGELRVPPADHHEIIEAQPRAARGLTALSSR
ncbi:hypothetical protein DJ71_23380, partial [Halorubrum sp. E3]